MGRSKRRQIVVSRPGRSGELAPLGTLAEVESLFARFNTGRDGADPKGQYTLPLHGPGFTAEVPTAVNPVVQVMLSVYDEELAMPVLIRMARDLGVRLTDIESGQTFG